MGYSIAEILLLYQWKGLFCYWVIFIYTPSHLCIFVVFKVEKAVIHPEYDLDTVDNDVALLRLPMSVRSDRYRSIACLPKSRQILPFHQMCSIIGWGKRRSSDMFGTDVLQEAQVI